MSKNKFYSKGGIIMLRFNFELTRMIVEAKKQAELSRNAEGIATLDILKELIDDPVSWLYDFMYETAENDEIEAKLEKALADLAARDDVKYDVTCRMLIDEEETIEVKITRELFAHLQEASEVAEALENDAISPMDVVAAIVFDPSKEITKFFRSLNADIATMREDLQLCYAGIDTVEPFPEQVNEYLSEFTGDDTILGRNKEIDSAWNILLKKTKRNVILVGDQGVGKTAIVRKMASQIKRKTAPKEFRKFKIYSLDVSAIISGTKYRGEAEERFQDLIDFMKTQKNAILFIDEAHLILGAGSCEGSSLDLANALKPLLAGDESRVIAATTNVEYEKYFTQDPAIRRRFEKVSVDEPRASEVYMMIKTKIEKLSEFHNVTIDRQMVDFIALYANCFFQDQTKNPDRTLDLIDRSMVIAKRKKKASVDQECVLANFKAEMELFKSMSLSTKTATAYHEAGHYIAYSFLPFLRRTVKPVVVSIYPAENYLGVTVTEKRKNVYESRDRQAYIEEIAVYLAGGIAEELVSRNKNDGVSSDSEHATEMAKLLITRTGFFTDFFYQLESFDTEKSIERQISKIKEILEEAKRVAESVITSHRKQLDIVAKMLLDKKVVSDEQLRKAMQKASKRPIKQPEKAKS